MMTTGEASKSHGRLSISASAQPRALITPTPSLKDTWTAQVLTLFPTAFPGVLGESLSGKALQNGLWALETVDLRLFGQGKHRNVDDTPSGGGAGMVMRADVLGRAIDTTRKGAAGRYPLIYLSPRGKRFDQAMALQWARAEGITLLCGRFRVWMSV